MSEGHPQLRRLESRVLHQQFFLPKLYFHVGITVCVIFSGSNLKGPVNFCEFRGKDTGCGLFNWLFPRSSSYAAPSRIDLYFE